MTAQWSTPHVDDLGPPDADEFAPQLSDGNGHDRPGDQRKPEPLEFIDVTAWENQPVPERRWAVLNRIPDEEVTLLSGEGAIGKSLLLKMLGVATVIGRDWIGAMPEPGPVIYVTAEEKPDELHYRLHHIAQHYGTRLADLGDFHPRSLKGEDAVLAVPDRNGIMQPTKLYERLFLSVQNVKPRWVGIDPSACVFAGKESDRAQVQQFVNLLARIALQCHCAVILVSHPSLTGINTGTGISGTTQWHNAVRSRLYLKRATTAEGDEPDPLLRELEVMKQNYGPVGERVRLRWRDGAFVSEQSAAGSLERLAQNQKADDAFLTLLKRFAEQGQDVSPTSGTNFAPAAFARHPDAGGFQSKHFRHAAPARYQEDQDRAIRSAVKKPETPGAHMTCDQLQPLCRSDCLDRQQSGRARIPCAAAISSTLSPPCDHPCDQPATRVCATTPIPPAWCSPVLAP
jgi:RecA-family ATPase